MWTEGLTVTVKLRIQIYFWHIVDEALVLTKLTCDMCLYDLCTTGRPAFWAVVVVHSVFAYLCTCSGSMNAGEFVSFFKLSF